METLYAVLSCLCLCLDTSNVNWNNFVYGKNYKKKNWNEFIDKRGQQCIAEQNKRKLKLHTDE